MGLRLRPAAWADTTVSQVLDLASLAGAKSVARERLVAACDTGNTTGHKGRGWTTVKAGLSRFLTNFVISQP